MNWNPPAVFLLMLVCALPTAVAQTPSRPRPAGAGQSWSTPRSAERWVQQLENELDHLQEDLYFERGSYPEGLRDAVEQAATAVAHFHHVMGENADREHLLRDFQEMDQEIHQLANRLEQSGDAWLSRQASRIRYPDEQLHYALQTNSPGRQTNTREVVARQAHLLEQEANNLLQLVDRLGRRERGLRQEIESFADEAEHFHDVVEQGAEVQHLEDDFSDLDAQWHRVVSDINQSGYGLYLRRTANNVNRVHNQIHNLLAGQDGHGHDDRPSRDDRQRVQPRDDRPAVEFSIPGIGRFRIPR